MAGVILCGKLGCKGAQSADEALVTRLLGHNEVPVGSQGRTTCASATRLWGCVGEAVARGTSGSAAGSGFIDKDRSDEILFWKRVLAWGTIWPFLPLSLEGEGCADLAACCLVEAG